MQRISEEEINYRQTGNKAAIEEHPTKDLRHTSDIKQQFSEIFSELAQNPKDGTDNPRGISNKPPFPLVYL